MEFIQNILVIISDEIEFNPTQGNLYDYQIAFEVIYVAFHAKDYSKIVKVFEDYSFNIHTFVEVLSYNIKSFIREYTKMLRVFNAELLF